MKTFSWGFPTGRSFTTHLSYYHHRAIIYPHQSSGSVVFQNALTVYSTRHFMLGDCRLRWDSVMHTHVFYLVAWFQREHCESLLFVTIRWHDFCVHGEVS
jgi:hypothetical protein